MGRGHSGGGERGKHKGSFTFARRIKLGFKDLEQFFDNLLISLFYLAPTSAGCRRQAYQWTACLVLVEVIARKICIDHSSRRVLYLGVGALGLLGLPTLRLFLAKKLPDRFAIHLALPPQLPLQAPLRQPAPRH